MWYFSVPLKCVVWVFQCNIGKLCGVIMCDNQICGILCPILMNYVCYLSGPPQWVRFQCNITVSGDAFKWHTTSAKPQKDFCLFGPFSHFSACWQVSTNLLTLDLMIAKAYGSLCLSYGLPISLQHILSKTTSSKFFQGYSTWCRWGIAVVIVNDNNDNISK